MRQLGAGVRFASGGIRIERQWVSGATGLRIDVDDAIRTKEDLIVGGSRCLLEPRPDVLGVDVLRGLQLGPSGALSGTVGILPDLGLVRLEGGLGRLGICLAG